MKQKSCKCPQCKQGWRQRDVSATRHLVKQQLHEATKYAATTIANIVDTLPVAVTIGYTD